MHIDSFYRGKTHEDMDSATKNRDTCREDGFGKQTHKHNLQLVFIMTAGELFPAGQANWYILPSRPNIASGVQLPANEHVASKTEERRKNNLQHLISYDFHLMWELKI